jgi:hypothetical protein
VLQRDGCDHSGIPRRIVNRGAALLRVQEDFREAAIIVVTNASHITETAGLDIQQRVSAPVR